MTLFQLKSIKKIVVMSNVLLVIHIFVNHERKLLNKVNHPIDRAKDWQGYDNNYKVENSYSFLIPHYYIKYTLHFWVQDFQLLLLLLSVAVQIQDCSVPIQCLLVMKCRIDVQNFHYQIDF